MLSTYAELTLAQDMVTKLSIWFEKLQLVLSRLKRKPEPQYAKSKRIAEWYNSWSNFAFIVLAIHGLFSNQDAQKQDDRYLERLELLVLREKLWVLMLGCGVGSFIHHSTSMKYWHLTIFVDWICIALSLYVVTVNRQVILPLIPWHAWTAIAVALLALVTDHVGPMFKVPWGHVFWHVSAAVAMRITYGNLVLP